MDISDTNKVKNELKDENYSPGPPLTPPQGLIEFFLDSDYKNYDFVSYYNKCLDETDGKFKNYNDVSSNQVRLPSEGDFKNYCYKCDKQFNSLLAAQNHYIFTHPDPSFLTRVVPLPAVKKITSKKRNYNWLNEPVHRKAPIKKKKESSNIVIIKDKEEFLKKLLSTDRLVRVTEDVVGLSAGNKGYTLENIKVNPQEGITVVKKSDIQFNQLRTLAKQKLEFSKKPEVRLEEAPPKKQNEPSRQLMKINLQDCLKNQSEDNLFHKEFFASLQKSRKTTIKYLCIRCNLQMFDLNMFDVHMRQHRNATFVCPFCTKTISTRIGIAKHTEACKNRIVPFSK